ncbi:MAG: hypothetical protein GJU72_07460 [Acidithiobacillus ferriphilus]|jgi:hypothetical protein|uniref:hypothetical protein n=1 Tax=Acidithiobacillus ferriphilus TaxID=1689834 RepID=UPI00242C411F|nr:hypothetical protein [Acidithiobacillus ferriphilus]MBW9248894.1 hypothetical protein [Acidithiobacillus ferriphilus]MBW9254885.1 hypothetical protein [Acidithiobacillus ferriphilus]
MKAQKKKGRGFPVVFRARVDAEAKSVIDGAISVIHPDFRSDIEIVTRWLAGEDVIHQTDDPEEQRRIALILVNFGRLSTVEELDLRTRMHALDIAREALQKRYEAMERARSGNVPRPVLYTNQNPQPVAEPTRGGRPNLRVV